MGSLDQGRIQGDYIHQETEAESLLQQPPSDLELGGLKRRIKEASSYAPLERLALSPQCGFASTLEGNLLTEADQEAKLRLVAETAREVWG